MPARKKACGFLHCQKPEPALRRLTDTNDHLNVRKGEGRRLRRVSGKEMTKQEFSAAIVRMQPTLYRVSYSVLLNAEDCADAVQECILRAWSARDRLRHAEYMQTWVIRILLNVCYDMRRKRRPSVDIDEVPEPAAPPDADRELHDAIAGLEEKLRVAVTLHYMEGYSVEEMARLLRCPTGTVKSRLRRARLQLQRELTEEGGLCGAKG